MKRQCINPYLPLEEHIPDGEPRVFDGRLYVFGSHDKENGSEFCELDYVAWSAPVEDLSDWRYEGVIYRKDQDPYNTQQLPLYAPDVVQGQDGRYYLYYCVKFQDAIHVAVADTPQGPYEFYARVSYPDGRVLCENQPYDPSVLCCDGKVYLYYGFAPCMINIPRYRGQDLKGCSVVELGSDMCTVLQGPTVVLPSLQYGKGTSFEGNEYFEGPSIRKIGSWYYLIYSSVHTHQLCYARSTSPLSGFTFGGCIVSNGDVGVGGRTEQDKLMSVGNNHGGLVEVNGQWYIFYHRHTSLTQYNRQGCAERIAIQEDGHIPQVSITTSGMNPGPLSGICDYPAVYCCNLTNGHMGALSSLGRTNTEVDFPFLTCTDGQRYVTNIGENTLIGYKYLALEETGTLGVEYRCQKGGQLEVRTAPDGAARAVLELPPCQEWECCQTKVSFDASEQELYFVYHGSGRMELLNILLRR